MVGELWDEAKHPKARLLQLDWEGKVTHQEDLPMATEGNHCAYDLRPSRDLSGELIFYASSTPANHQNCRHEFWRYSPREQKLEILRSIETDYSWSNSGKWLPLSESRSVFINNPSLGQLCAWSGHLLGTGEIKRSMLPKSNPIAVGLQGSYYVMSPSPLVGSMQTTGESYLMTDAPNAGKKEKEPGPCSLLLYRLQTVK